MSGNLYDRQLFQKAFKKLKSNIYYDKTNLILRDKIVEFEADKESIDKKLNDLQKKFEEATDEEWGTYIQNKILNTIDCLIFPKSLMPKEDNRIISNFEYSNELPLKSTQAFIDMNVEGHILGVIWILLIGWQIDKDLTHCYGNRISEYLHKKQSEEITFSPSLFKPYFINYETWRDSALEVAEEQLQKNEDVLILTLDFTRFYYSLDITDQFMESTLQFLKENQDVRLVRRINQFVYKVIERYSEKYREYFCEDDVNRNILPIGFLPSNILANYALRDFDNEIIQNWNPIYFGRYVDDILIVDKLDKYSGLCEGVRAGFKDYKSIISHYFLRGNRWGKFDKTYSKTLFYEDKDRQGKYYLCNEYTGYMGPNCKIELQNDKFKIFCFSHDESDALIKCFREQINQNKSEFRFMPEDEVVFQKDDYLDLYNLGQYETNKLRDISDIQLNKFKLSKYLGKYQRICGIVETSNDNLFIQNFHKIFNKRVLIENYTAWEKIISILYVNQGETMVEGFIDDSIESINRLSNNSIENGEAENELQPQKINQKTLTKVKVTLKRFLVSGIIRTLSLSSSKNILENLLKKYKNVCFYNGVDYDKRLEGYFHTRMNNKSMCSVWIDLLLKDSQDSKQNLYAWSSLKDILEYLSQSPKQENWWERHVIQEDYKYYPYIITMADLILAYQCYCLISGKMERINDDELLSIYYRKNFHPIGQNNNMTANKEMYPPTPYYFSVGDKQYKKIKVAVSNIKLAHQDAENHIMGALNRSYTRYKKISRLVNTALEHKANLLVMPECCIPFEWLGILAKTCAKNNLAVVTGVEHIIFKRNVYNLVAIILPFQKDDVKLSAVYFHSKNYFAPSEVEFLKGYGYCPMEANVLRNITSETHGKYEIYKWNDFYFTVYCCYELTSIGDRSLPQSIADAVIAIEWNRDVKYYSNILESLSRDLHCYCIQVNSSDYGDSRITQPTKNIEQDILRVKGGDNPSILMGTIDIDALRRFQIKEYSLQQKEKRYSFKPTPPQLDKDIIWKKIHGEDIFDEIRKRYANSCEIDGDKLK